MPWYVMHDMPGLMVNIVNAPYIPNLNYSWYRFAVLRKTP